jgi:hypothetical protein
VIQHRRVIGAGDADSTRLLIRFFSVFGSAPCRRQHLCDLRRYSDADLWRAGEKIDADDASERRHTNSHDGPSLVIKDCGFYVFGVERLHWLSRGSVGTSESGRSSLLVLGEELLELLLVDLQQRAIGAKERRVSERQTRRSLKAEPLAARPGKKRTLLMLGFSISTSAVSWTESPSSALQTSRSSSLTP